MPEKVTQHRNDCACDWCVEMAERIARETILRTESRNDRINATVARLMGAS